MMQNGRINSPKLRPRLSSRENRNRKTCHMLRERGVDKKIRTYQHHVTYYNSNKLQHKTFITELLS